MKLSLFTTALTVLSACTSSVFSSPTPTTKLHKRAPLPGFVSTSGKDFIIDGVPSKFGGTNAYWMFLLNDEQDIIDTFQQYKDSFVKVVRIWGFREVIGDDPVVGNFTQRWIGNKATCSPDGIARIKFILDTADSFGIKVILALTNNWSVNFPAADLALYPPGYFSNSYGGIDTYVQQIAPGAHRDEFYTNSEIIAAYQNYLKCIVPAFKTHAAVFSWELANDPRCQGAVGTTTSSSCTTTTITKWVKQHAAFIKQLDPNHLTGAGDGGFQCTQSSCVKVNTLSAPAAQASQQPLVNAKRRRWLTTADVLARARGSERAARALEVVDTAVKKMRIRGGWAAPATLKTTVAKGKRQDEGTAGTAYNGHWGVDSADICADHNIDFCSIQIFPDQDVYAAGGVTLSKRQSDSSPGTTTESVNDAVNFILNQASDSSKPVAALAVGVTSSSHSNHLNHFDSTNVGSNSNQHVASDSEQQTASSKISSTASSINAMLPWQQGKRHVHSKKGSIAQGSDSSRKRQATTEPGFGDTPDDGYAFYPGDPLYDIWLNSNKNLSGAS